MTYTRGRNRLLGIARAMRAEYIIFADENGDPTRGSYGIYEYGSKNTVTRKSTEIG